MIFLCVVWGFVSALLFALPFMNYSPYLVLPAVAPLMLYWMAETSIKRMMISGFVFQWTTALFATFWIKYTAWTFFAYKGLAAWAMLIGVTLFSFPGYIVWGALFGWAKKRYQLKQTSSLVFLFVSGVVLEVLFPRIFPFHFAMMWQQMGLGLSQWADTLGMAGLSVSNYLIGTLLAYVFISFKEKKYIQPLKIAGLGLAVLIVFNIWGSYHGQKWQMADSQINVQLFQPNIVPVELLVINQGKEEAERITFDVFTSETIKPEPAVDVTIWNETAMPFKLSQNEGYSKKLKDWVKNRGIPLITGGYWYEQDLKYNSVVKIEGDGSIHDVYHKRALMPMGEFLPGESTVPILRKWLPMVPTYGQGKSTRPLQVGEAKLGVTICYETLFSQLFNDLTKNGANILLSVSSDYWFGPGVEPFQTHLSSRSRAMEFRRPHIRVVDTGITSVTLATGEVIEKSPEREVWQKVISVPYLKNPPRTFFDLYGKFIHYFHGACLIFLMLFLEKTKRRL